jgi:hypothetical protein
MPYYLQVPPGARTTVIGPKSTLCLAAKWGPNVLFCVPDSTSCMLLLSAFLWAAALLTYESSLWGAGHGFIWDGSLNKELIALLQVFQI